MTEHTDIEPGQDWEVDLFRPEDAEGVTRLFLSIYGEDYPIRTYIEPKRLTEENAAGRVISSVARTPRGDIVGHNALFRSAPCPLVYESGAGVVHRDYRGGKGIFTRMNAHSMEVGPRVFRVETIFGESVCNHLFAQKMCYSLGFIKHALEVDLMPASAYVREQSAEGRVAALLEVITLAPHPHTVYVPEVYRDALDFLYDALDDRRERLISVLKPPPVERTRLTTQVFDFAQVARVAVEGIGDDVREVFEAEEGRILGQGVQVLQIWLRLACPWVGGMVDLLRQHGYFLGGLLPRWFDEDGLLMQKTLHRPHWEGIRLQNDRARGIFERVKGDWEAVRKRPQSQ